MSSPKAIKTVIEEEDKNLTSAFDSCHDFLLGDRSSGLKKGDSPDVKASKKEGGIIKKAAAATILYDFINNTAKLSDIPTAEEAADKRIRDTKALIMAKAHITAFNEPSYMEYIEKKYDVLIGLGQSKYGDYPKISYKDLLTCDDAKPSKACEKALESRIICLPAEVSEETDVGKLKKIRSFICKFYKIRTLNISADGPVLNVFSSFLHAKKIDDVKFLLNWANKFDPAGGMVANDEKVYLDPHIKNLPDMPGSELSTWLATKLGKKEVLKLNLTTTKVDRWNQTETKNVKLNIGPKEWYSIDPNKRSPGVGEVSETFVLDEKTPAAPPRISATESPKILRANLTKIITPLVPSKNDRQRFYIAYFMDLKEAGDRSQIYWVSDVSSDDYPIVFLTNDRMCSLIGRMKETIDVVLGTDHRVELFKAYKKVSADPIFPIYQRIQEQINNINQIYGFSCQFASMTYFENLQSYLRKLDSSSPLLTTKETYTELEIAASIPSVFVSLHAAAQYHKFVKTREEVDTFLSTIKLKKEELPPAMRSDIATFVEEAGKLKYITMKPYVGLGALKTVEKLSDIHAALEAHVNAETFEAFKTLTGSMNLQIEYKGDTIVIGGQTKEDSGFLKPNADLTKLQFGPSANSLFNFKEDSAQVGLIPCSVSRLQPELINLFSKKGRLLSAGFSTFLDTLTSYSNFFEKDSKFYTDYAALIEAAKAPARGTPGKAVIVGSLETFLKGLITIANEYWTIALARRGGQTPYGSQQSQMLLTPLSPSDVFKGAKIVQSAYKAFQKTLQVRNELQALLGDSLETLPTYEVPLLNIMGGTRRQKRRNSSNTRKLRQRGGGVFDVSTFPEATIQYLAALQAITHDFKSTVDDITAYDGAGKPIADDYESLDAKRDLTFDIVDQIIDLNTEYINSIAADEMTAFMNTEPLASTSRFDTINDQICAITASIFGRGRCDRTVGKDKMVTEIYFRKGEEDSQITEFIGLFAIALQIELPPLTKENRNSALYKCIHSILKKADDYIGVLEASMLAAKGASAGGARRVTRRIRRSKRRDNFSLD